MAGAFVLTGDKALAARLASLGAMAPLRLGFALYQEAEAIMGVSKPLVPVDTGVLRGSGVVLHPQVSGNTATVEFGYGGGAEAYAWPQHERLDYSHTVGQAKFLEQPVMAAAAGLDRRLAARLGRSMFA